MGYIATATVADADTIAELRRTEYARSLSFTVENPEPIGWTSDDEDSLVLGAWDDSGQLIATMRGRVFWSMEEAEEALITSFASFGLNWPCLGLTRAATNVSYRSLGLNSSLRFHFLSLAQMWGISHILGCPYRGAPRIKLMERLGYTFCESPDVEDGVLKIPKGTALSAVLDLHMYGEQALVLLDNETSECRLKYPWRGEVPRRPWGEGSLE